MGSTPWTPSALSIPPLPPDGMFMLYFSAGEERGIRMSAKALSLAEIRKRCSALVADWSNEPGEEAASTGVCA